MGRCESTIAARMRRVATRRDQQMTDEASMDATGRPRVLFVYYTYTQQSLRVVEAMADVLRERGCDVRQAGIDFTDERWRRDGFSTGPVSPPSSCAGGTGAST